MSDKRVLVLGATGYTGRQTVLELKRLGQPMAIGGRDRGRLQALHSELALDADVPVLVGDATRPASLPPLFSPDNHIGAVINCVGPFTRLGEPVVRAAVEAGVHYLDITGEQAYLARIISLYDTLARQKGCAVVPACGFEFAMTNWAAALVAKGHEPLDELWTGTVASQIKASRGTQLSLFEALAEPGLGWKNGSRVIKMAGSSARTIEFGSQFGTRRAVWSPFGELVTIPRHIKVKNMSSYLALPTPLVMSLRVLSPVLPALSQLLGYAVKPLVQGPQPDHQENSRWAVVAEARHATGGSRIAIQGRNVYGLTAVITGWCATRMLQPDFEGRGGLGPAQAFDPQAALDYLKEHGVSYTLSGAKA